MSNNRRAFTFIELLIALSVMAISFLPLMRMFSVSLEQVAVTRDMTTARYLAQEGMERVKNLSFTQAQLMALGDVWHPVLNESAVNINGSFWRVLQKAIVKTDPLEIHIMVYQLPSAKAIPRQNQKPAVELVTLVADLDWTQIE